MPCVLRAGDLVGSSADSALDVLPVSCASSAPGASGETGSGFDSGLRRVFFGELFAGLSDSFSADAPPDFLDAFRVRLSAGFSLVLSTGSAVAWSDDFPAPLSSGLPSGASGDFRDCRAGCGVATALSRIAASGSLSLFIFVIQAHELWGKKGSGSSRPWR